MSALRSIGAFAGGVSSGLQAAASLKASKAKLDEAQAFREFLKEANENAKNWMESQANQTKSFAGQDVSATPGNPATMPITQQAPAQSFAPNGGFGPTQEQAATLRAVAPTSPAMVTSGMQPPRKVAPFAYSSDPFGD